MALMKVAATAATEEDAFPSLIQLYLKKKKKSISYSQSRAAVQTKLHPEPPQSVRMDPETYPRCFVRFFFCCCFLVFWGFFCVPDLSHTLLQPGSTAAFCA